VAAAGRYRRKPPCGRHADSHLATDAGRSPSAVPTTGMAAGTRRRPARDAPPRGRAAMRWG